MRVSLKGFHVHVYEHEFIYIFFSKSIVNDNIQFTFSTVRQLTHFIWVWSCIITNIKAAGRLHVNLRKHWSAKFPEIQSCAHISEILSTFIVKCDWQLNKKPYSTQNAANGPLSTFTKDKARQVYNNRISVFLISERGGAPVRAVLLYSTQKSS